MGSINQGAQPDLPRWRQINRLRGQGLTFAAIGQRLGVTRQCTHRLYRSYRVTRRKLTIPMILEWADAYFARMNRWPRSSSPRIPGVTGLRWQSIESALRLGFRGLPGGSSLAQVLAEHRKVRNVRRLPKLTTKQVLSWAKGHYQRVGRWPNENSGEVTEAPGEVWRNIDMALREGFRGLPGGSSLSKLLATRLGVRTRSGIPKGIPLRADRILEWADAHFNRSGKWPNHDSGPITDSPEETWLAVESGLRNGLRGLPGGSSLAELLAEKRGVRNRGSLPRLEKSEILAWAKSHYEHTGRWPTGYSGPVVEAPGETWKAVEMALYQGQRGLRGRSTLSQLLRRNGLRRGKASKKEHRGDS